MTDMKRVAVLAAVIAIAAVILIVLLLCRSASFVQPTETTAIVPDDLDSAALSVAADGLGTAPSPEVIRNELFTPVISFHPGSQLPRQSCRNRACDGLLRGIQPLRRR